jgi:replicative DNA helicase
MNATGRSESRQQEVTALSRGIKQLARELAVPVVCLSQLNRQVESRTNNRPRMSDLRESGSIEQDADVVILLHREDYYHRGESSYVETNEAELIVEKQRNGPTGVVKLMWDAGCTRFKNLSFSGTAQPAGIWG